MLPDLNPIGHEWYIFDYSIAVRRSAPRIIDEFKRVFMKEWVWLPQGLIRTTGVDSPAWVLYRNSLWCLFWTPLHFTMFFSHILVSCSLRPRITDTSDTGVDTI
ncbi:hypothetical protein TNCV_1250891 [Trichonephila clavipes]|nr:hypothetical protein TNCV_1250891 [Trichonephila clavipes]